MPEKLPCPNDGSPLVERLYEKGILVDMCDHCGGVLLNAGELKKIQQTIENDYSEELKQFEEHYAERAYEMARQETIPQRNCPRCSKLMEKCDYGFSSQIMLDVCLGCKGIWLDKGELEALEIFFESSRLEANEIRRGFFASLLTYFT